MARSRLVCVLAGLVLAGLTLVAPAQAAPQWPTGATLVVDWKGGGRPGHALAEVSWPHALQGTGGPVQRYEVRIASLYGPVPVEVVEAKAGTLSLLVDLPDRRQLEFQVTAFDAQSGSTLRHKVVARSPDSTPPVVTWSRAGGGGCDAPFAVTVETAEDDPGDPGGPTAVATSLDAGLTWSPFTGPLTLASAAAPFAPERLRVWVRDAAGNVVSIDEAGVAFDPDGPAGAVAGVRAAPGPLGHALAWDPVVATGAPVRYLLTDESDPSWKRETAASDVLIQVPPGVTHRYVITPVDACERAGTPSSAYAIRSDDATAPSEPVLDATVDGALVRLVWEPASDDVQVDRYLVERGGEQIAVVRGTSWVDAGAPDASVVRYAVVAVDSNGNRTSSPAFTLRTPDRTSPGVVPGLTVSTLGSTAALSWGAATDNVGVAAYEVRRDGGAAIWRRERSYGETGVAPGEHRWEVRALDSAGNSSPWSGVAGVTRPDIAAVVAGGPKPLAGRSRTRALGVVAYGAAVRGGVARLGPGGRLVLRFAPARALPAGSHLIVKVAGGSGWLLLHRAVGPGARPGALLGRIKVAKGATTLSLRLGRRLAAGAAGKLVLVAGTGTVQVRVRPHQLPVLVARA